MPPQPGGYGVTHQPATAAPRGGMRSAAVGAAIPGPSSLNSLLFPRQVLEDLRDCWIAASQIANLAASYSHHYIIIASQQRSLCRVTSTTISSTSLRYLNVLSLPPCLLLLIPKQRNSCKLLVPHPAAADAAAGRVTGL